MEEAGFVDPTVDTVEFTVGFRDVDAWWDATASIATRFADAIAGLDAAGREDLRTALARGAEPFETADGRLEIPARTWVATAAA